MNAIVSTQTPQLPAHLQHLAARNTAVAAMGGIKSGQAIHQISIKASKWRLQDPQGGEQVVPMHHLDVIIVDANPNASKVYYEGAYDPSKEGQAPTCFSDNGATPSDQSEKKQSVSCAACPHNVWGTGKNSAGQAAGKACSDSKKLAVILAENPTGAVYLLKIPPASLKNLYAFVEQVSNRGIPLPALVVRLQFDAQADYPKITFDPVGYCNPAQGQAVDKVLNTPEVAAVIGTKDAAPVALVPAPAIAAPVADTVAALPAAPTEAVVEAPKPRGRKKAEPPVGQPVATPASQTAGFFAALNSNKNPASTTPTAAPVASNVVVNPPATSQALDDLIKQAMTV